MSRHKTDENSHRNPYHEPVWVQCDGYRCLAVLDSEGRWRTYVNRALLEGVIRVLGEPTSPNISCRQ